MSNRSQCGLSWGAPRLLLVALLAGCSGGSSTDRFHPKEDIARGALTAALNAWQSGQPKPDGIESDRRAVHVTDASWQAGSKLKSFEIVEALPGDGPQKFAVKLILEGAAAPEDVKYVVVGNDPLWVMRENEYERGDM